MSLTTTLSPSCSRSNTSRASSNVFKIRDASTSPLQSLHAHMEQIQVNFIGGDFNMSAFSTFGDVFSATTTACVNTSDLHIKPPRTLWPRSPNPALHGATHHTGRSIQLAAFNWQRYNGNTQLVLVLRALCNGLFQSASTVLCLSVSHICLSMSCYSFTRGPCCCRLLWYLAPTTDPATCALHESVANRAVSLAGPKQSSSGLLLSRDCSRFVASGPVTHELPIWFLGLVHAFNMESMKQVRAVLLNKIT